jgi:hypothetical protein
LSQACLGKLIVFQYKNGIIEKRASSAPSTRQRSATRLCQKTALFNQLKRFLSIFVPSLSWQMFGFFAWNGAKPPLSCCIIIAQFPIESHSEQGQFAESPLKTMAKSAKFGRLLCDSQYNTYLGTPQAPR